MRGGIVREGFILKAKDDIRGFTLAEMLMSVAIILILVLIAIPSIVSVQKNMHLLELDNAAKQVAAAVQTQMTADKVSGTWLEKIDKIDKGGVLKQPAKYLAPDVKDKANTYYLTADQVRNNGLLPSLAIDSVVRDNDYVVEFNKTTATVCGVFYSDNKTGWFSADKSKDKKAAQAYYGKLTSSSQRDKSARQAAEPMIGYFGGRSEGATPAIALEKPAIWVNGEGKLCVQDPNLRTGDDAYKNAALQVTITKQGDASATFTLVGLQKEATGYSIGVNEKEAGYQSNTDPNQIFELVAAEGAQATDKPSVYVIDINKIKEYFSSTTDPRGLSEALGKFALNDDIDVEAKITLPAKPCVPATAQAHIKWPGVVPQFRILMTAPQKDEKADPYNLAGRIDPAVNVEGKLPEQAGAQPDKEEIEISSSFEGDPWASKQTYSGLKMGVEQASKAEAVVRAHAGNYRQSLADGNSSLHQYQLYEIWINETLIGAYGKTGVWEWKYPGATECFKPFKLNPQNPTYLFNPQITQLVDSVDTVTSALPKFIGDNNIPANKDKGYTIHLRTAPSTKDVQTYYAKQQTTDLFKNLTPSSGAITARDQKGNSDVQLAFRGEFGCSSSVALWTVLKRNLAVDGTNGFSNDDLSVYYAPTPFAPSKVKTLVDKSPTCAALWRIAYNGGSYAMDKDHTALAQELPKVASGTGTDFLLPYDMNPADTAQSQGYFRTLVYYGGDNGGIQGQQWVPLYSVNLASTNEDISANDAKFLPAPFTTPEDKEFIDWRVRGGADAPSFAVGDPIYGNAALSPLLGRITLDAHYRAKPGVGVLYVEFDKNNKIVGYYGSVNGEDIVDTLKSDGRVASWEYCVVVPKGDTPIVNTCDFGSVYPEPLKIAIQFGDPQDPKDPKFDLHKISPFSSGESTYTAKFSSRFSKRTIEARFNLNFAAAVEVASNKGDAQRWGKDPKEGGLPWQVRHADQMIMNLGWRGGVDPDTVRSVYLNNFFLQTHDIEWGDHDRRKSSGLPGDFTGNYTSATFGAAPRGPVGPGVDSYAINGFEPGSVNSGNALGLFPRASKAAFSNIKLTKLADPSPFGGVNVNVSNMGLLVGAASGCSFDNCQVVDDDNKKRTVAAQQDAVYVGSLIGRADSSSIKNCSVSFLNLTVKAAPGSLCAGGLVGMANNCEIVDCHISNLTLNADVSSAAAVEAGGLAGHVDRGSITNCSVGEGYSSAIGGPNKGSVTASIGGLVGYAVGDLSKEDGSLDGVMRNCFVSSPQISYKQTGSKNSPALYCGGLVGWLYNYQIISQDSLSPVNSQPGNGGVLAAQFSFAAPISKDTAFFGGLVGRYEGPYSWIYTEENTFPVVRRAWFTIPAKTEKAEELSVGGWVGLQVKGSSLGSSCPSPFVEVFLVDRQGATIKPSDGSPLPLVGKQQ